MGEAPYEKVIVVTRKTALEDLIERFNTRDQARFYIEHMGASFEEYEGAHEAYVRALDVVRTAFPPGTRHQILDRSLLPNFVFGPEDLVVTLGPDGLVVNAAKYLDGQPLLALNPDPQRMDGVLVPFRALQAGRVLESAVQGRFTLTRISMARAELNDGQVLHAVNDLFIGQRTHVSARYRIACNGKSEDQSSSGIIVSTGVGSTGWFRSVLTGAARVVESFVDKKHREEVDAVADRYRFDWEADHLVFSVREPFISNVSRADLVYGRIGRKERLVVTSQMPQNGVIFSDGIEEDYLEFNSGSIARIGLADRKIHLITNLT